MLIYKDEQALARLILDNQSLSYCAPIEHTTKPLPKRQMQSLASMHDGVNFQTPKTDDLYYTRSILVSTNTNFNGDHFDPRETWAARKTPVDKPTNIGHDPDKIVGHITSQWAIGQDGNLIADDINAEEIPQFFHIANGSVIYRKFPSNEDMQAQSDLLVEAIDLNKMFVSMECLFNNFQFAVKDGDTSYLVARNEDTAFLTKHLRAYGGTGEFEGMVLARSLMNINFSGKGFVEEPANKDSIIFAKDVISKFSFANFSKENPFLRRNGVYVSECVFAQQNKTKDLDQMADNNQDRIKELEATVASLNKELIDVDSKALKTKISELEAELKDSKAKLEEAKAELNKEVEAKACMCGQMEDVVKENEALKAKLTEEENKRLFASRTKVLTDKGYETSEAEAIVKDTISLDEKTWNVVSKRFEDKSKNTTTATTELTGTAEVEIEETEETETKVEASVKTEDTEMTARAARIKAIAATYAQDAGDEN